METTVRVPSKEEVTDVVIGVIADSMCISPADITPGSTLGQLNIDCRIDVLSIASDIKKKMGTGPAYNRLPEFIGIDAVSPNPDITVAHMIECVHMHVKSATRS